jgi:dipeptidyl aminopeptidase/acylaminoacyl peptidase
MGFPETSPRSRVPWALAVVVGLCSGLAGYVIHAAITRRIPKQVVQVRRLTDMAGMEESPAISPDGKTVAFVAAVGDKRQIWVLQLSGGAPRPITKDDGDYYGPRWSADSNRLIYFASSAIWEIPAVGGEARKMVEALGPGDLSHHAGNLAFFRRTGDAVELVTGESAIAKLTGTNTYSNLRWSPDDKKIAYLRDQDVMVIDASGGEPVRATDFTVQGFAWAPDNSGLMVSTRGELWFVPRVENKTPFQLTFGELSYESPDIGAAGLLVASRGGLYASGESDIVMFSGLKW